MASDGKRAYAQEANGDRQLAVKKQRRQDGTALAVSARKVEPEVRFDSQCPAHNQKHSSRQLCIPHTSWRLFSVNIAGVACSGLPQQLRGKAASSLCVATQQHLFSSMAVRQTCWKQICLRYTAGPCADVSAASADHVVDGACGGGVYSQIQPGRHSCGVWLA